MTQPPNIREVDCCANCEFFCNDNDYDKFCFKHGYFKINNICDDFKREE